MNRYVKGKYSWIKHLDFIVLDIVSLIISFIAAYAIKFNSFGLFSSSGWKEVLVACCLLDLVIIFFSNPFSGIFRRYKGEEILKSLLLALYNFIFCCIYIYFVGKDFNYSRAVLINTYALYFVLSSIIRITWKKIIISDKTKIGVKKKTILVVGNKEDMPRLLRSINSGFLNEYYVKGLCMPNVDLGVEVEGRIDHLDDNGKVTTSIEKFINSTTVSGMVDYVVKNKIEEVFVGLEPTAINSETYKNLIDNGKKIHLDIISMIGFKSDDQFITSVGIFKTLDVGFYSFTGKQLVYLVVKRFIDIIFGLIGLIAIFPLMVVVKISYLISGDKKSIFYSHNRVGLNGKNFKMYKFRSMVYNADEVLENLLKDQKYKNEWEENQKIENDPRITKIGNFLRKTSLDEIPQFINVLKGDMSLVGPRPLVVGELESHDGLGLYNMVKPGITGWWGCNGRSNTSYDERLDLEYYYVKNCSLYLDTLCIIKTIGVILRRDGAK